MCHPALSTIRFRLNNTKVTDAGMMHLKGLTNLESLDLSGTDVWAAGLVHLRSLTKLQSFPVHGKRHMAPPTEGQTVPEQQSIAEIKKLGGEFGDSGWGCPTGWVRLMGPQITDAALEHLRGLTRVYELHLTGTQVTDEGIQKLQEALPDCEIHH